MPRGFRPPAITLRHWQCLTLSVQGWQSGLYLNGIAVSRQTWNRPMQNSGAPAYIGSVGGKRDFLNAKLAAFSIRASG